MKIVVQFLRLRNQKQNRNLKKSFIMKALLILKQMIEEAVKDRTIYELPVNRKMSAEFNRSCL